MQRLWINNNAYCGERIEIGKMLSEIESFAKQRWAVEHITYPKGIRVPVLRHKPNVSGKRIYISAGIHGDEPAGPLALLSLLKQNSWPEHDITVIPCLNPYGFSCNRRENEQGIDLNRDYLMRTTPEVSAHTEWLERQPDFDLSLCLHEDWEAGGFYVYELKQENGVSLADALIEKVSEVFPIETAPRIDSYPAKNGVIDANQLLPMRTKDGWPEAVWLFEHKHSLNYTLETSSDFILEERARALALGVETALKAI